MISIQEQRLVNTKLDELFSIEGIRNNNSWWLILEKKYEKNVKTNYEEEDKCLILACLYVLLNSNLQDGKLSSISIGYISESFSDTKSSNNNVKLASTLLSDYAEFSNIGTRVELYD